MLIRDGAEPFRPRVKPVNRVLSRHQLTLQFVGAAEVIPCDLHQPLGHLRVGHRVCPTLGTRRFVPQFLLLTLLTALADG